MCVIAISCSTTQVHRECGSMPALLATIAVRFASSVQEFLARDSIYAIVHYKLSPVHWSVSLSVTRVDQSKTVEVRIMQLSPHSSPMTL